MTVRRYRRRFWLAALLALGCLALSTAGGPLPRAGRAQALALTQPWNLIADPGGIVPNATAFTLQMNDTTYETVSPGTPLVAGLGYWVPASAPTALPLGAGSTHATIIAPAGQFVMIGDPSGILPATVTGADLLLTVTPSGFYQPLDSFVLQPGQGAFAVSYAGGSIVLTATGTAASSCNLSDTGSACPVAGACPAGYPVAITPDTLAHPAPVPGAPTYQGTPVLCFNDLTQAVAAGYQIAPPTRIEIDGPVSATSSDITVVVTRALLESPEAFMARLQAAGDQLCTGCDVSGATAIVTVEYGLENANRPPTLVTTGYFLSKHLPIDRSPAYVLLASENEADPALNGSPTGGTLSGVFAHVPFADVDTVEWRLDTPLCDTLQGVPEPHGPNIAFQLHFRGPQAGQMEPFGSGSVPLKQWVPGALSITPFPAPPGAAAAPSPGLPVALGGLQTLIDPCVTLPAPAGPGGAAPAGPAPGGTAPAVVVPSVPIVPASVPAGTTVPGGATAPGGTNGTSGVTVPGGATSPGGTTTSGGATAPGGTTTSGGTTTPGGAPGTAPGGVNPNAPFTR